MCLSVILCLLCPSVVADFIQRACARAYHFYMSVCLHTNSGLCSPTEFAVLSVRPLSPASLSRERTFSRRSRRFSNGEHDVTSKSSMYARTYSKFEKSSNMRS